MSGRQSNRRRFADPDRERGSRWGAFVAIVLMLAAAVLMIALTLTHRLWVVR